MAGSLSRSLPFRILLACVAFTAIVLSYQIGRIGSASRRTEDGAIHPRNVDTAMAKSATKEAKAATTGGQADAQGGRRALLQAERTDAVGGPLPMPSFTVNTWEVQKRNRYMMERNITCHNADADAHNAAGIDDIHSIVHQDIHVDNEEHVLRNAVANFDNAIAAAPSCQSALVNKAIVCFALKDYGPGLAAVQAATQIEGLLTNKAKLWEIIYSEQDQPRGAVQRVRQMSKQILKDAPEFGMEYYGVRARDILDNNPNAHQYLLTTESRFSPYSLSCIHRCMSRLLLVKEFSAYFGGYPVITYDQAKGFPEKWYISVPNMLPPFVLETVQYFYNDMITHGQLANTDPQAKRFVAHNDPPARFLMAQFNDMTTRLADRLTKPTYTYFGSYYGASVLAPHRDRLQCEFTLSLNIDINPRQSQCPLGFSPYAKPAAFDFTGGRENMPPPEERVYVYHRPGDAVLIKGRNIVHWRDQMPPNFNCSQVFLHYVFDDFALGLS